MECLKNLKKTKQIQETIVEVKAIIKKSGIKGLLDNEKNSKKKEKIENTIKETLKNICVKNEDDILLYLKDFLIFKNDFIKEVNFIKNCNLNGGNSDLGKAWQHGGKICTSPYHFPRNEDIDEDNFAPLNTHCRTCHSRLLGDINNNTDNPTGSCSIEEAIIWTLPFIAVALFYGKVFTVFDVIVAAATSTAGFGGTKKASRKGRKRRKASRKRRKRRKASRKRRKSRKASRKPRRRRKK